MQAFKKAKRRFKERVSEQVLGTEKFVDPVFDASLDRFNSWNYHLQKVEEAHLRYVETIEAQNLAAANLADVLVQLHFSAMQLQRTQDSMFVSQLVEQKLKTPVENFARIQTVLGTSTQTNWYREAVIAHSRKRLAEVPSIQKRVHKRDNMVLDYSAYARKVEKSAGAELTKRMEREKKLKESRATLDDQTKSLLTDLNELESTRPSDLYEDICSVLALQLDSHRRASEFLENELPKFTEMAYPLCQLSVLSSAKRILRRVSSEVMSPSHYNKSSHGGGGGGSGGGGSGGSGGGGGRDERRARTRSGSSSSPSLPDNKKLISEKVTFNSLQMETAPSTSLPSAPKARDGNVGFSTGGGEERRVRRERMEKSRKSKGSSGSRSDSSGSGSGSGSGRASDLSQPRGIRIDTNIFDSEAPPLPVRSQKHVQKEKHKVARVSPRLEPGLTQESSRCVTNPIMGRASAAISDTSPPLLDQLVSTSDFVAASASELSMSKGDRILVLKREDNGWWLVRQQNTGKAGWVPSTFF